MFKTSLSLHKVVYFLYECKWMCAVVNKKGKDALISQDVQGFFQLHSTNC